jgi:hypothetical protein
MVLLLIFGFGSPVIAQAQYQRMSECEMFALVETSSFSFAKARDDGVTFEKQSSRSNFYYGELAQAYGSETAKDMAQLETWNLKTLYFNPKFAHTTPQKFMDFTTAALDRVGPTSPRFQ